MANQRKTETKRKIKRAFAKLLLEKGIDNLTVSDIARESHINRGTFYLHYLDKYDLLEKLETEVLEDLQAIFDKYDENKEEDPVELIPYEAILEALNYVLHDFDFVKALVNKGGDHHFIERFKQLVGITIGRQIKKSDKLQFRMEGLPEDYAFEILLSSILAIVQLWIKKDAAESPEEIAEMINKAKQLPPYQLLL